MVTEQHVCAWFVFLVYIFYCLTRGEIRNFFAFMGKKKPLKAVENFSIGKEIRKFNKHYIVHVDTNNIVLNFFHETNNIKNMALSVFIIW